MIDLLHKISLLFTALHAKLLRVSRAENLIKRSIKAFEMLKANKGIFEKKSKKLLLLMLSKMLILLNIPNFLAFLVKSCSRQ